MKSRRLPVVVIGSGVAGMVTALAAAPSPVRLLCRSIAGSASVLAQGGIAAAVGEGDTAQAHILDTLEAGCHHNDIEVVRWLCEHASGTVEWLQAQGVAFDRTSGGHLQLGREGGHGRRRIVHAGGDATGARLVQALRQKVDDAVHVRWREGMDVDGLLMRNGRVTGIRTRDMLGRQEEVEAAAVVLATGGIGALYAHTSNPSGADGAGLALALTAGVRPRDLEFVQFHPTGLAIGGHSLPLLTEALRGAGATLVDSAGAPLMHALHPLGDLAPRDIVARRVWQVQQTGGTAWLDATSLKDEWEWRFPTVLAACLANDLDPREDRLPITPVAHFHMGGIATDLDGRTSLAGLYAVGEVACNGVHGANRLASNSLLEATAFGRRLGTLLAATATVPRPSGGRYHWVERGVSLKAEDLLVLRELMWRTAGVVRGAAMLRDAWRLCTSAAQVGWQVRLAKALLRAMRLRTSSLGAHFREDRGSST